MSRSGRSTGSPRFTEAGQPSMSTNPIADYHVIYAIAPIVVAVTYVGNA
ncbi:hypothetical protein H4W33_000558 [Kibdelosporangium phytohabitans]|nr:hypothetical protein [Kibdelosporangium phytohabitans]